MLVLNPVILGGLFVVLAPIVGWLSVAPSPAFDVPGVPDAVGLRLSIPAPGPACSDRRDDHWGLAFGTCEAADFVIDYVAFVRGQYQVSVVVGTSEQEEVDLAGQRGAALRRALVADARACQVAIYPTSRTCS